MTSKGSYNLTRAGIADVRNRMTITIDDDNHDGDSVNSTFCSALILHINMGTHQEWSSIHIYPSKPFPRFH